MLSTRHSSTSIRRYVQTFLRVVELHRQAFSLSQIAHLVQSGEALIREYLAVYEHNDTPECRTRLEEHLQRLRRGDSVPDGLKKGGAMSSQAYVGSSKRTFQRALIHELETNYGFLNSKRMLAFLAADIQQLVEQFYPRRDYLPAGWVVFAGTKAAGPKPFPGLDASTQITVAIAWPLLLPEDIDWMASQPDTREQRWELLQRRVVRLLEHGWQHPDGPVLLTQADLSLLLGLTTVEVSTLLQAARQAIGKPLLTKGYFFDQGMRPTHKAEIIALYERGLDEAALGLAASIGAKVLRLGLSWRLLEPNGKGQWDTTWYIPAVRYRIEQARSYGMDVQILLLQTPCWASSDPAKRCIAGNETWDDAYPPANYRDYADAFRKLIEAYGDLVNTWEVWNEPNIERFWKPAPDADAYVQLLAVTYSAIKEVQSNAIVLGGSLAGADLDYLWAMYDADAKGRFDALALHPYSTPRAPDDCTEREWSFTCGIDQVRSLMLRRGDDRPIYLTEFGWSTYSGINGVSEETQRQYLIEALESLAVREYVTAAAWYTLVDTTFASLPVELPYDNDFGLFTANHRPKLAAVWLQTQLSKPFELFLPTVRR